MTIGKLGNLKNLSALAKAAKSKTEGDASGKVILTVPVEKVVSKVQVRKKFLKIDELAESIKHEGLQAPIIVSPANSDGNYVIQKGERRWRAVKLAGLTDIDVIVNNKEQSDLDETAGELIENIQRDDLKPFEIAEALQKFVDAKWSQIDIAKRIGKGKTYVSSHLLLLKLPECVKNLYDQDKCSDPDTLINLGNLFSINKDRCEVVCRMALENGITRKESRDLLDDAKRIQVESKAAPIKESVTQQTSNTTSATSENALSEQNKNIPGDDDIDPFAENENNGESATTDSNAAGVSDESQAQTNKPAKKKEGGSEDAMGAVPVDPQWKIASPDNLIFVVNVKGDTPQRGVIVTDRIANEPTKVCIKVMDGKKEKHLIVPISNIELIGIEHQ